MDSELIEKAADAVDAAWQKRAQEGRHDSLAECAARAAFAVFEAAQKPTDDEREALAKALNRDARRIRESRDRAGIEFGSMTVPIDVMLKLTESAPSLEPLTEPSGCPQCHRTDGQHKLGCGERFGAEPQIEPTDAVTVQLMARPGGKTQALIESMLAQANERGIRVEIVHPEQATDRENGSAER